MRPKIYFDGWVGKDKDKLIILSAGNSNKISIFLSTAKCGRGKRGQAGKAEAASAWHCQLKLTVKQTTQQGHLSSDNSKRKSADFPRAFLFAGVAESVQSL